MSARLASGETLQGQTSRKTVPSREQGTPSSFGRPPPRPGPALRPFCRIGEISAQDSRGGSAGHDPGRFQAYPPDPARDKERSVSLKSSLKTTSRPPQPRGLSLILITEGWAPWSSAHRKAKEGRNQHPRMTEFSPPCPSRRERCLKTVACLDRVRPRGCGGVGIWWGGRGGVQGWPRSGCAAVTAQRRNHSPRCRVWEEEPDLPVCAPSLGDRVKSQLKLPAAPPLSS